ncbi:MAG: serine/threonine-protein kinase [Gemmataceae bacterium]
MAPNPLPSPPGKPETALPPLKPLSVRRPPAAPPAPPADAPTPPPASPATNTLADTGLAPPPLPVNLSLDWGDEDPASALQSWSEETPAAPNAEAVAALAGRVAGRIEHPQRIGQYRLLELIGEGGMGQVYKAEDVYLKRQVALKVMKPAIAKDELSWKLFWNEARATAALQNPRIATVYQVGEDGDTMFLAMELLKGESLESRLKRGPLSLEQAIWVVREAALGLTVAHHAGFTHRDIKPGNLWLELADGHNLKDDRLQKFKGEAGSAEALDGYHCLKLLDFGLVRVDCDANGKMKRGAAIGTPAYMAPEQAAGALGDPRSDLFSLGVVLFRLVTNRLPFPGDTPFEIMAALASQTAPLASEFNPHLPPRLVRLIQRMLSRDPIARPRSAADVAEELLLVEEETLAAPPPAPTKFKWWHVAIPVALLVVCAATYFFLIRPQRKAAVADVSAAAAADRVFGPAEVLNHVGERVTVEFSVKQVLRAPGGGIYLTAEQNGADDFRAVLSEETQTGLKGRGFSRPDLLLGAKFRLHGLVIRDDRFTVVQVAGVNQIEKLQLRNTAPK